MNSIISMTSSKGSQNKWVSHNGNIWYKEDLYGGEVEAEYLVSEFLKTQGFKDFVVYEMYSPSVCWAYDFTSGGCQFVTFYRILKGKGITDSEISLVSKQSPQEQLQFIYGVLT